MSISHNTITGVTDEGIDVGPGTNRATHNSVTNVQIVDNTVNLVSTASGLCCQGIVLLAGTDAPSATVPSVLPLGYPDANSLTNVLVQGNVVAGTLTSGILIEAGGGAGGSSNVISGVIVDANQVNTTLEANGIKIVNGSGNPLGGRIPTSNQISKVSIEANRVSTGTTPLEPANGYGAIDVEGGGDPAQSSTISTLNIVNNVVTSTNNAIVFLGGEDKGGATVGNAIEGVQVVNDTVVNPSGDVLVVTPTQDGTSSNTITGLSVVNCILWGSIEGSVSTSMLGHNLVKQASFARHNGNVTGNPQFVSVAKSNYRLQVKSPARGKGTAKGAPTTDINGRARPKKHVDLGAYQSS